MSEGQSSPGVGDRPQSILFVCTGNICRSPIAERILRTLADTAGVSVTVTSAGVGAQNGAPMHPLSVEALDEHGYDAAGFEAHYLRPQILDGADLVLTMTREHRAACQRTTPARWKRTFTLNEFVELVGELDGAGLSTVIESRARIDTNAERLDIVDPMGQPKEAFERVFAEIEPRVLDVASWLAGGAAVELPGGREPEPVPVEPVADDGTPPPEDPGSASSGDDTPHARWWRNRWLWIVLGVLIAVVVIGAAWLAYSAFAAKGELESARTDAQRARTAILDGDQKTAKQAAQSAADEAGSAADRTDGVVWSAAAAIPWLGKPLDSVTQISSAVSDYASQVLVPSADLSSVLSPSQLRRGDTISTAPLRQAQPQLAAIAEKSEAIATRRRDRSELVGYGRRRPQPARRPARPGQHHRAGHRYCRATGSVDARRRRAAQLHPRPADTVGVSGDRWACRRVRDHQRHRRPDRAADGTAIPVVSPEPGLSSHVGCFEFGG